MLTFKEGGGVLNSLINKLPVEVHIPGYQYCGPGTKLQKRLARGDPGRNPLDAACKQHDIAYSQSRDLAHRHEADRTLEERAWSRVKAKDSSIGEKAAAWTVTNAMKVKRKLGMGLKKPFRKAVVSKAKNAIKKFNGALKESAKLSLTAAKIAVRKAGGKKHIRAPRIIPIPKRGGILPLIPIFAGLSALGSLAGGAAGIAHAVNKTKSAQKQLAEAQRHNKVMEDIALKGEGLYMKQYRKGLGLYLKPPKN